MKRFLCPYAVCALDVLFWGVVSLCALAVLWHCDFIFVLTACLMSKITRFEAPEGDGDRWMSFLAFAATRCEFAIPAEMTRAPTLEIAVESGESARPADLGRNPDKRVLGVVFSSLSIVPAEE